MVTRKMARPNTDTTISDARWRAVVGRDSSNDGRFVYAVATTGVYCRPSCAARRPDRANVTFFGSADEAESAGFRACLRCKPQPPSSLSRDLRMVYDVCGAIETASCGTVSLAALAHKCGLSEGHLQRTFKRVVGISPRDYAKAIRETRFRATIRSGITITDARRSAGYGSTRGLYENSKSIFGMTPATYARKGRGADISYAIADSPLGRMLVAATTAGICAVKLGYDDETMVAELSEEFSAATSLSRDDATLAPLLVAVLSQMGDNPPELLHLPLDIRGTAFQWRVWDALRKVPVGQATTYRDLGQAVGSERGARAAGAACGANPVALIIPCHRAIGSDGSSTGYRWGIARKEQLLEHERNCAEARGAGSANKPKRGYKARRTRGS